jgi:pimeloyl-ACP methyl ester carboxylesterase
MYVRFGLAALALLVSACVGGVGEHAKKQDAQAERFPMPSSYPPGVMEQFTFEAGVPERWRLSAWRTPERADAAWKIVVVTGTPSWSAFWAPAIAAAGPDREMVVADRPGFAQSEPKHAVTDIEKQAEALAPMLQVRPGERVVLVGQSFGAPIAIMMAKNHPDQVNALVLLSAYFGDRGPTANRMYGVGRVVQFALGRDLKNALSEVHNQRRQLPEVWSALSRLSMPVLFVHGDRDSFITLASARRVAQRYERPLVVVPHGDHFINACCVAPLMDAVEQAIATAEAAPAGASSPAAPALP